MKKYFGLRGVHEKYFVPKYDQLISNTAKVAFSCIWCINWISNDKNMPFYAYLECNFV